MARALSNDRHRSLSQWRDIYLLPPSGAANGPPSSYSCAGVRSHVPQSLWACDGATLASKGHVELTGPCT